VNRTFSLCFQNGLTEGRDPVAVEKHIKELELLGVKRPATTPIFYRVSNARLTTDNHDRGDRRDVRRRS
jgi:hypothetical protein